MCLPLFYYCRKQGGNFFRLGALCRQPQQLSHPQPLLPQPQPLLPHPQPLLPQQNMITRSMIIQPHPLPNPLLHISFPPFPSQQHLMSLQGYVLQRQTLNYGIFIRSCRIAPKNRPTEPVEQADRGQRRKAPKARQTGIGTLCGFQRSRLSARRDHSFIVP